MISITEIPSINKKKKKKQTFSVSADVEWGSVAGLGSELIVIIQFFENCVWKQFKN